MIGVGAAAAGVQMSDDTQTLLHALLDPERLYGASDIRPSSRGRMETVCRQEMTLNSREAETDSLKELSKESN